MFPITLIVIFFVLLSFFIGSIPTGYWFCKYFFNLDITQHGSGNIGATNVARVLMTRGPQGIVYFFYIFFIDFFKAFFLLYFASMALSGFYPPAALENLVLFFSYVLLVGNAYSIFLRFKGGKGVATTLGIIAYLIPFSLLMLFVISWLVILSLTRQVFIGSLGATFILTIAYGLFFSTPGSMLFYFLVILCCWITFRHKENIRNFMRSP